MQACAPYCGACHGDMSMSCPYIYVVLVRVIKISAYEPYSFARDRGARLLIAQRSLAVVVRSV